MLLGAGSVTFCSNGLQENGFFLERKGVSRCTKC